MSNSCGKKKDEEMDRKADKERDEELQREGGEKTETGEWAGRKIWLEAFNPSSAGSWYNKCPRVVRGRGHCLQLEGFASKFFC